MMAADVDERFNQLCAHVDTRFANGQTSILEMFRKVAVDLARMRDTEQLTRLQQVELTDHLSTVLEKMGGMHTALCVQ